MTASAPFFRALVVYRYQVYSVKGADAVIQSALSRGILEVRYVSLRHQLKELHYE